MAKNKKSRMYEGVRTWNVFKGCKFDCTYCVQREQAKRQKHRCEKCYNYEPHFHAERLDEKFKAGETVFVAAAGDISFAATEQWIQIFYIIKQYPKTTFLLQSKNPQQFRNFEMQNYPYPSNVVLGTTIETNRDTSAISNAPAPIWRYYPMQELLHRKYVTIEPILDFDLSRFTYWIEQIAPEFVYVGYLNPLWKAKKLQLPEPSLEKTKELCEELDKITEVRLKTMRNPW